jgi:hypothetical protein
MDWEIFSGFVRGHDRYLFGFVDDAGALQGFFSMAFLPTEQEGRRLLLMYSKYFYFRPAYRGHYLTTLAPWRLLPIAPIRTSPAPSRTIRAAQSAVARGIRLADLVLGRSASRHSQCSSHTASPPAPALRGVSAPTR